MSNSESKHARVVLLEKLVDDQIDIHARVHLHLSSKIEKLRSEVRGAKKLQKAAEAQRDAARHTLKCTQG